MLSQIKHFGIERQDLIGVLCVNDLHAGDLLWKGPLHLAILDLRRVQDFLKKRRLFDPLVNANCWWRQQQDESIHSSWIDNLHDSLSGGRWIECRLFVTGETLVDIFDHSTVVLADRDCKANLAAVFVFQGVVARGNLDHLTLRVHIILNDHVELVDVNFAVTLTQNDLAAAQEITKRDGRWNFYSVEVGESL